MKRPAALVGLFVIAASAGCGVRPTGPIGAGEAPTAQATALPESKLYFIKDGAMVPVTRAVSPWDSQAVFDALVAGPTAAERARGISTALTRVGKIEVVSGADGMVSAGGFSKMIILRIQLNSAAQGPFPLAIVAQKGGYVQIACTGRALATHPFAVELQPDKQSGGVPPQPYSLPCPQRPTAPDPSPSS